MTRHAKTHNHTFSTNFFGAVGYVAIVFVWLLVLDAFIIIASLDTTVGVLAAQSLGSLTSTTYENASSTPDVTHMSLQFLMIATLAVLSWVFCYMTARISSGVLKHMFALFGRKLSVSSLTASKYLVLTIGLIGLVILIQFIPPLFTIYKLPLAFLGFLSGIIAVSAVWVQGIVAERHNLKVDKVL